MLFDCYGADGILFTDIANHQQPTLLCSTFARRKPRTSLAKELQNLRFCQQQYFNLAAEQKLQPITTIFARMTWLKIIFPVYLLILSCMPCADTDDISTQKAQTIISANHSNTNSPIQKDVCTPFCSCSHCPASAFFQPLSNYNIVNLVFQTKNSSLYKVPFTSEISFAIWQPPKLS